MKHFMVYIFLIGLMANVAIAQELTQENTGYKYPGIWKLSNQYTWAAISEKGEIIPLSTSTTVYGCGKRPIFLTDDLNGASIDIICQPSHITGGIPDIISATIICR